MTLEFFINGVLFCFSFQNSSELEVRKGRHARFCLVESTVPPLRGNVMSRLLLLPRANKQEKTDKKDTPN